MQVFSCILGITLITFEWIRIFGKGSWSLTRARRNVLAVENAGRFEAGRKASKMSPGLVHRCVEVVGTRRNLSMGLFVS